jgi:protocatechuate 3,4-dioxygenase beta subunit
MPANTSSLAPGVQRAVRQEHAACRLQLHLGRSGGAGQWWFRCRYGQWQTGQVTLSSGDNLTVRAGLTVQQATLGDRVWEDSNGNGVQDSGEQGVDGVTVDLKDSLGNTVASTVTHDGGQYSFTVDPGTYSIAVTAPTGYGFTGARIRAATAVDSDIDAAGKRQRHAGGGPVQHEHRRRLCTVRLAGDVVWNDANRNGVQDSGETGVPASKSRCWTQPAIRRHDHTDVDGHYQFNNLPPGTYSVQFDKTTLPPAMTSPAPIRARTAIWIPTPM